MLKRSRFFISATLVAVLFTSLLLLSNPNRTIACPVSPPPATLLGLYLQSDLIVTAEIASEKDAEVTDDYEDFYYIEVVSRLKVSSALKGKPPAGLAFVKSEYRSKTAADPEPSGDEDEEEVLYAPYGYKGQTELRVGANYLFFLTRNPESGKYELTDPVSGARQLGDYDLSVHAVRLKELSAIAKMKKNQAAALTAWLVRCAEETSTRWDGVFDLNNSFRAVGFAEESTAPRAFRLDNDFSSHTPELAENLTEAQKAALSNIAFSVLQQNPSFYDSDDIYYGLTALVKNWDNARLAMFSFSMLEGMDKSDSEKTGAALNYVAEVIDDEELTAIAARFSNSEEEEPETEEEPAAKSETSEEKPAPSGDVVSAETGAQNPESADLKTAPATEDKPADDERAGAQKSPDAKKPTLAEIRAQIYQDFVSRYQFLVANGFRSEEKPADATQPADAEN